MFIKFGFGIGVGVGVDEYGNDDGPMFYGQGARVVCRLVTVVLRAVRVQSRNLNPLPTHKLGSWVR
jgi:hypothetical protein